MLREARIAARIEAEETAYDEELADLLEEGAAELREVGILIRGRIAFSRDEDGVKDLCTVTDHSIIRALKIYVAANFRNPPDYEKLLAAYNNIVTRLKMNSGHTVWGNEE